MLCVELCAGTAGLTAELLRAGFNAIAFDHQKNAHRLKAPCVEADLSTAGGFLLVRDVLSSVAPFFLHAGPPCGTASRARERPIPDYLRRQGAPEPKPLRSSSYPLGVPGLTGADNLRVTAANNVYETVAKLAAIAHERGAIVTIENPARSFLWEVPCMLELQRRFGFFLIYFHQCMFGGSRKKLTGILTNSQALRVLEVRCDDGHAHEPFALTKSSTGWTFSTAAEAEYPPELCRAIVAALSTESLKRGIREYADIPPNSALASAAATRQSRKMPPLIPEFKTLHRVVLVDPEVKPARNTKLVKSVGRVPAGSKILSARRLTGAEGGGEVTSFSAPDKQEREEAVTPEASHEPQGHGDTTAPTWEITVGEYHTFEEFFEKAKALTHPFDLNLGVPEILLENIFVYLTHGPEFIARERAKSAAVVLKLVKETQDEEKALHASLDSTVQGVIKGKRLVLLKKLLQMLHYPDVTLADDIARGFELTGVAPPSGAFETELRPPVFHESVVRASAEVARRALVGRAGSSGDPQVDSKLYEQTLEEVDKGWMRGPYTEAELADLLGADCVVSRRFAITQGKKLRAIDDFTASSVNGMFGSSDKIQLAGVDTIAGVVRAWAVAVGKDRSVVVRRPTGGALQGWLHESLSVEAALDLIGATFDLKSAYRQLPVSTSSKWCSSVAVYDPNQRCMKFFVADALPFGATASVYAFLRASKAIWEIGARMFRLCWTSYFDDFSVLTPRTSSSSSSASVKLLFSALGWESAVDKEKGGSQALESLGVHFALDSLLMGFFEVRNKPGRVEAIVETIDEALDRGRLSPSEAASLRGRLLYAESQLFGRFLQLAGRRIGERAISKLHTCHLDGGLRATLEWVREELPKMPARKVTTSPGEPPVLLFTDGACEFEGVMKVTVGAVLWDPSEDVIKYFGMAVDPHVLGEWGAWPGRQVIGQAELYPILLAKRAWRDSLIGRRLLLFVDNEAAKFGLIKGYSDSPHSENLLRRIAEEDLKCPNLTWVSRVPSSANVADAPSRLDFEWLSVQPRTSRWEPQQPSTLVVPWDG